MGKNTKIICTVVPNPYKTRKDIKGRYFFSVFLSPRLPESGKLMDYYEIAQWYEFWDFFRKSSYIKVKVAKISYDKNNYTVNSNFKHSANVKFDDSVLGLLQEKIKDRDFNTIGRDIYKKLFNNSTPVSGWILDEGEPNSSEIKEVISFDDLKTLHKDNYTIIEKIKQAEILGTSLTKLIDEITSMPSLYPINDDKPSNSFVGSGDVPLSKFRKDISGHKVSSDEIRFTNKENQEFHKKLSILSNYPHLMRLTGWILDFYIEKDLDNPLSSFLNQIKDDADVTFKNRAVIKLDLSDQIQFIKNQKVGNASRWINFFNEIDFKTPWTYFQPSDFSVKYSEVLEKKYFKVEKGYIMNTESNIISASQFDMKDYVGKKIQNSLSQLSKSGKDELNKTVIDLNGDESKLGKLSTGISVYVNANMLKTAMENNPDSINLLFANQDKTIITKQLGEVNIDDYVLFGHNIDTGYRIDVAKKRSDQIEPQFYSLCKRVADYAIDKSPYTTSKNNEVFLFDHEDEPWISESAQAGTSGTLYVDEELFRWNNWSLTCPHLGEYPQDEKTRDMDESTKEFNDIELMNIYPHKITQNKSHLGGPLLRLRFGGEYAFKIRIVDLCGNSPDTGDKVPEENLTVEEKKFEKNPFYVKADKYERYEKVEPAEIFFEKNIYTERYVTKKYKEVLEDGTLDIHKFREITRVLNPIYLGEDLKTMVIRSMVDTKGTIYYTTINCIRYLSPPRVTPQLAELHGMFDNEEPETVYSFLKYEHEKFEALQKNGVSDSTVQFITDPVVAGLKLTLPQGPIKASFNGPYFKRNYVPLILKDSNNTGLVVGSNLVVSLKPGNFDLYTITPEKDTSTFGKEISGSEGALSMRFIHAVQRPIFLIKDNLNTQAISTLNLKPVDRTPKEPLNIKMEKSDEIAFLDIPMRTTCELRLIASYSDYVKKETVDLKNVNENGYSHKSKPETIITSFSNLSESLEGKEGELKIPKLLLEDESVSALLAKKEFFKELSHSFGDTKYRKVTYKLEFVSRFKEFIENKYKEADFYTRELTIGTHSVLNSQKPKALQIDKAVPLFRWEKELKDGVATKTRINDTFRVYFKDEEWFTTGEDEGIAVLYKNSLTLEDTVEYSMNSIEDGLNGLVTEFGKDPAVGKQNVNKVNLEELFVDDVDMRKSQKNVSSLLLAGEASKFSAPIIRPTETNLNFKTYKIKYNGKQFYCDIKIMNKIANNFYFPFIKLALTRYQDNSIIKYTGLKKEQYDFRFSNVIAAPHVQVLPNRQLVVDKDSNIQLKTFGIVKSDYRNKPNEFWLITESELNGDFTTLAGEDMPKSSDIVKAELCVQSMDSISLGNKSAFLKSARVFIEEYEYYELDDEFKMNETEPDYNPRNDVRKRLVFTYNLKNL